MKLSYFSYDFWECCCEAVNAGGWAGVFRRFSAVSLAVNPTHFSIATRVAKPPIAGSSLLLGRAALSARGRRPASLMALLVVPRVFRAPEGPAAREARASLRSAPRLEARPCPPDPPAPSTPVGPGHCSAALRIGLKPGQAPPPPTGTAARPPHPHLGPTSTTKFALLASISAHAQKSSPSAHKTPQNRPFFACWANFFAVWTRIHSCWANFFAPMGPQLPHNTCRSPCLKPMTPMRVGHCLEMKPLTPLRAPFRTRLKPLTPLLARNDQFRAIFCPQRCHGFHAPLAEHPQRR